MKMIRKIEQPEAKFDLYFMGYDSPKAVSHANHFSDREGLIELTHNYGTENDPNYKVATGNAEPFKGFGHTCISVDNLQAACQRIEDAGYKFQKKLTDGRMKNIAFVLDPDGYWVEVIGQNPVDKTEGIKTTDVETYRMVSRPPCGRCWELTRLEPYHDSSQGPGEVLEILSRSYWHEVDQNGREQGRKLQPLFPRLPRRQRSPSCYSLCKWDQPYSGPRRSFGTYLELWHREGPQLQIPQWQ
jgi:lactoylglutathione lyase